MRPYYSDTTTRNGTTCRVEYHYDPDHGTPWENDDGTGIVSEWTTRTKRPGEVILHADRQSHRLYDLQGTTAKATRDGWRMPREWAEGFAASHGRPPTAKETVAAAVRADFERLREWCRVEWFYCGVVVFPLTADGDELRSKAHSVWGLESDDYNHLAETVEELLDTVAAPVAVPA
jgi:hypothetical protein